MMYIISGVPYLIMTMGMNFYLILLILCVISEILTRIIVRKRGPINDYSMEDYM